MAPPDHHSLGLEMPQLGSLFDLFLVKQLLSANQIQVSLA
eukprot:CAMPEP_0171966726 /NCGR_PEP_ID=MMETSP0993-20121228/194414_1 /TAXON_ID=483369 /ORGANISM="non described non described, Strain CCMP2098" /LENGTH=39 /DNA_ID= /DNA_START= /DNA_END= /DNA_ORIENTATION=